MRQLGRTGLRVSDLCLGCMMFGGKTDPEPSYAIIDRAIDSGINFLDTANVYSRGRSEEVTGQALSRNGKRSSIVLATKVHGAMSDDDPNMQGNHRRNIIEQCEASLRRLGTDWIDLYQIHRPQSNIPIDETLRAMDDLVRSGKVRYIGTSTFAAWQSVEALWVAERYSLNRFVSEQPPYNILDRRIERELLPMAQTYGYGIIPWSPLGGGLITGKYRRGQDPDEGRYIEPLNDWLVARKTDAIYDVIDGLDPIATKHGATLPQVALAWVRDRPGVTSPIIGPRTMEQFDDNIRSAEV
ncbi:MAG: aldo/keto reductase, partial [Thermoanaerobaculales bacterium]|nr:aldo/keto reductase [Thermoanaerobaculales bacterium]